MEPEQVAGIVKSLTKAQAWALDAVARGRATSPANLGQEMMERPGATKGRTLQYKAQGYGRMGGTMMARLERMGLVTLHNHSRGEWQPTSARLTPLGLAVRSALKENDRGE